MSNDAEWGQWIEHDGTGCPCEGQIAHILLGNGWDGEDVADDSGSWTDETLQVIAPDEAIVLARINGSWLWELGWFPVMRYRIRKPIGLTILKQIAANPPHEPIGKPVPDLVPA